jgi:dTDP-4-amino-4,6-dideoxygalactose transaminase
MTIPFARPFIGKEEEDAALRVLRSGWLTTGTETQAFEQEFAAFLNPQADSPPPESSPPLYPIPYTLYPNAVNAATSGLHLALEACGVESGDIVLVPSCTFTSTAEVVRYLGADVVFVDVAPDSFHIDPAALEETVRRLCDGLPAYPQRGGFGPRGKPKAVMPVHYGGLPCNMAAIMAVAEKYGLFVIEDAAHSFPSQLADGPWPKGSFAGTVGDAGVFSFYATKTITTGEGGMVVTRNRKIADRIAVMRSHGIDRSVWNRYTDTRASWYYEVIAPGYKYNIPDVLSAIGRAQLARAWDLLAMRQKIAAAYDAAFSGSGGNRAGSGGNGGENRGDDRFLLPRTGPGDSRHLYPLRLNPHVESGRTLSRNAFIAKLQEAGVGVSVHFIPLHTMPYYKNRYNLQDDDLPNTMAVFKQEVSLPIWPGMTDEQVERVIEVVKLSSIGVSGHE